MRLRRNKKIMRRFTWGRTVVQNWARYGSKRAHARRCPSLPPISAACSNADAGGDLVRTNLRHVALQRGPEEQGGACTHGMSWPLHRPTPRSIPRIINWSHRAPVLRVHRHDSGDGAKKSKARQPRTASNCPRMPHRHRSRRLFKPSWTALPKLPCRSSSSAWPRSRHCRNGRTPTRELVLSLFKDNAPLGAYPSRQGYEQLIRPDGEGACRRAKSGVRSSPMRPASGMPRGDR